MNKSKDQTTQTTPTLKKLTESVSGFIDSDPNSSSDIVAAYATGSVVRGDYHSELSDQDLLLIFQNSVTRQTQQKIADELAQYVYVNHVILNKADILYINQKELPLSQEEMLTCPFSIFSIFGFDLKENHCHIYGRDVLDDFEPLDPNRYVDEYLICFIEKIDREDPFSKISILSSQIIRCLFIKNNILTLNKDQLRSRVGELPYSDKIKNYIQTHPYISRQQSPSGEFLKNTFSFLEEIKPLIAK